MFTAGNSQSKSGGALPPTHPKMTATFNKSQVEKLNHFVSGAAPTPAIPGRTIRIILNKQTSISASKSANRVFNRSDAKPSG